MHYKPKLVGDCTYLAFNIVQINKVNEAFLESAPDGCLLISSYPHIAGQPTLACARVCVCVASVVHTPDSWAGSGSPLANRSEPPSCEARPGPERFRIVETMPRTYKIYAQHNRVIATTHPVAPKGRILPPTFKTR